MFKCSHFDIVSLPASWLPTVRDGECTNVQSLRWRMHYAYNNLFLINSRPRFYFLYYVAYLYLISIRDWQSEHRRFFHKLLALSVTWFIEWFRRLSMLQMIIYLNRKINVSDFYDSGSGSDEQVARRVCQPRRAAAGSSSSAASSSGPAGPAGPGRRRRCGISARERNLRRLESNERERMRMHSLNRAFEVSINTT